MFSICNIGTAFNMTTNNVNFYKKGNFYTSPVESLAMALNVSNKVRLDHSYPLFEYTIYIYR